MGKAAEKIDNLPLQRRQDMTESVKQMLIEQLNMDLKTCEIDNDAPLFGSGLGLDSVDALELVIGIEEKFSVHMDESDPMIFRSVNTIVDYLIES